MTSSDVACCEELWASHQKMGLRIGGWCQSESSWTREKLVARGFLKNIKEQGT